MEHRDLLAADGVTLIDVREPWESQICSIEGGTLLPMNSLPQRLQDIPQELPVALYCHHGIRSLMAAQFLSTYGFEALSLAGGIAQWAEEMDPGMQRY
ncbi:MAG: rhodanese-like domain-containing protein [Thermoanaerobaculia bacterium]